MRTENQLPLEIILVVTDITHTGSFALRYAKRIAELHGSKLVVVHAIDQPATPFPRACQNQLLTRLPTTRKLFTRSPG
jgi:hypothetical protein